MGRAYRNLKLRYLAIYKKCYWCKRLVKDYGPVPIHLPDGTKYVPDDAATIDHVISRYIRKKGDHVRKVLACNKCNAERADKDNKQYGPKKKENISN